MNKTNQQTVIQALKYYFDKVSSDNDVIGGNYFSFSNVAVMREFYLSKYDKLKSLSSAQFADQAFVKSSRLIYIEE